MNNQNAQRIIKEIIDRKRREDPLGLFHAEMSGKLNEYLDSELRKQGIYSIKLDSETLNKNQYDAENFKFVDITSDILDDVVYSKIYSNETSQLQQMVSDRITDDYKVMKQVNNKLKLPKVLFAAGGSFFALIALSKLPARRPVSGVLCALLSLDLFRMSYNCYIKTYCPLAGKVLVGDIKRFSNTLLNSVQSAVGLKNGKEDPIRILNEEIVWEAIFENTVTKAVLSQVKL